jgi:SAM-dependent methyltransferase
MASVQEHYASHLAPVYLWMAGGFERAIELGKADLDGLPIDLSSCRTAIDLGAGFGMHAVPLARRGCGVTAIDTSTALLDELRERSAGLPIRPVEADLMTVGDHASDPASLVLCMGDTLTHLSHVDDVERLGTAVSRCLAPGGHFVLTFRNYERLPQGTARFIPVRSDGDRILTCFLEEDGSRVLVHDILHERRDSGWEMRVSPYPKLRLAPAWVAECLQRAGLTAVVSPGPRGMACVLGSK